MNPIFSTLQRRFRLLFCVLFAAFAVSVSAETVSQKGITYTTFTKGTVRVTSFDSNKIDRDVVIPDTIYIRNIPYAVVEIVSNAFKECYDLQTLRISSNVKTIGDQAFYMCSNLERVHIEDGVESIGKSSFANCEKLTYLHLPSTLASIGTYAFIKNYSLVEVHVNTCYYDEKDLLFHGLSITDASIKSAFTQVPLDALKIHIPMRVYNWYVNQWPSLAKCLVPVALQPSGFSLAPSTERLDDYQQLSHITLGFEFEDKNCIDIVKMVYMAIAGAGNNAPVGLQATLTLSDGTALTIDSRMNPELFMATNNKVTLDFADVLAAHKEQFTAKSEADSLTQVRLSLSGHVFIEDCGYDIRDAADAFFRTWTVKLLPSVFDLPEPPTVTIAGEPSTDGLYDYTALSDVAITFGCSESVKLDVAKGSSVVARLVKGNDVICSIATDDVRIDGNTLHLPFSVYRDAFLTRRTAGINAYDVELRAEGLVVLDDGKNYKFRIPVDAPQTWPIAAEYIPEPIGVSVTPALTDVISYKDLTHINVAMQGVDFIAIDHGTFAAALYFGNREVTRIAAEGVYVEDNVLHLTFDPIDPSLITLISEDKDVTYDFSLRLLADVYTEGYLCRVILSPDAVVNGNVYTRVWDAPHFTVQAIVDDVPQASVSVPAADEEGVHSYEQLRQIVVTIDNYERVEALPAIDDQDRRHITVAKLMRNNEAKVIVNTVQTEDNRIIIDFGDALDYRTVGITPEDDADVPVELRLLLEGDFYFDGLPYHLVVDEDAEGASWEVAPVVIYQLPQPGIAYSAGRLYFTCAVEGVTYHYTVTNVDNVVDAKVEANKTGSATGGNFLHVPLTRTYEISVYATREGYDDSEVAVKRLKLDAEPTVTFK